MRASGIGSTGRAGNASVYHLACFTDSDPEPHPKANLYEVLIDRGDQMPTVPTVRKVGGAYQALGAHFYCRAGTYHASVRITKSPGAIYHVGESVTVKLTVTVARARIGGP